MIADFLRDIDQNQLPYSDHQAAVIEKTKQLKKLCTRLGGTQKEELFEPIKCQVSLDFLHKIAIT